MIDCLDRPVINRWYNSVKSIYEKPSTLTIRKSPDIKSDDPKIVKDYYKQILDAIQSLKDLGIKWPVDEPAEFDYSSDWCNRIHRYFTTISITNNRLDFKSKETYVINNDKLDVYNKSLHTLNNVVHILETYCSTPQKVKFGQQIKYLSVQPLGMRNKESYYKSYQFEKFEKEDFAYHTWEHYDVVFEEEILGKHILRSFLDNDNPRNIDTTGFNGWFGCFRINCDRSKQEIYNSDDFNSWLESHNTNKSNIRADFPIGNIITTSHPMDEILSSIEKSYYECITTLEFNV